MAKPLSTRPTMLAKQGGFASGAGAIERPRAISNVMPARRCRLRRRAQCLIEASGLAGATGPRATDAAKERDGERAQGAATRDRPGEPFAVRRVAGRRGLADRRSVIGRPGSVTVDDR